MAALNVSSRNVTPTPFGAADFLQGGGVHGLPFIISANRARRTQMTLPSSAKPATDCLQEVSSGLWSFAAFVGQVCRRPDRKPPALSRHGACRRDRRPRVLTFEKPDSSSRMNRVAAIQKSSRTITTHWTRPAIALPQGLHQFGVFLFLPRHGATARTGPGRSAPSCRTGMPCPRRNAASVIFEAQVVVAEQDSASAGRAAAGFRFPLGSASM